MPRAVLTGIDTKPAESLAVMLRSIGYDVYMLSDKAIEKYAALGYTGGVKQELLQSMGYSIPQIAFTEDVEGDIFVDLKLKDMESMMAIAKEKGFKLNGVLYPINGGWDDYEHYGDHYPTITNNFWVKGNVFPVWSPPVDGLLPKTKPGTEPPIGLLHNAYNWGFGSILDRVSELTGLRVYGAYRSPAGLIQNTEVPKALERASCFVHLKASDSPGWALYEAFATATPVVVTELFIARMRFQELYEDGKTCLTWGKGSFEVDPRDERRITEFIDANAERMIEQIADCVERLKDPELNKRIGRAGRMRWWFLTSWDGVKADKLKKFFQKNNLPL